MDIGAGDVAGDGIHHEPQHLRNFRPAIHEIADEDELPAIYSLNRERCFIHATAESLQQFDQFIKEGALGSHLENLQRHGGFKGFNQKSVSVVIAATDPRKQHFQLAPAAA